MLSSRAIAMTLFAWLWNKPPNFLRNCPTGNTVSHPLTGNVAVISALKFTDVNISETSAVYSGLGYQNNLVIYLIQCGHPRTFLLLCWAAWDLKRSR